MIQVALSSHAVLHDLALRALDSAVAAGANYADVRAIDRRYEIVSMRDGLVDIEEGQEFGLGVRSLVAGSWGFAASARLAEPEADRIGRLAVEIARAGSLLGAGANLSDAAPAQFSGEGPCGTDPFTVSAERKADLLRRCAAAMQGVSSVKSCFGTLDFLREDRLFVSSEGSRIRQVFTDSGGGLRAIAVGNGVIQQRSYPHIFGWHAERGGWEVVARLDLEANALRIAEEAVQLLTAPFCPEGPATVILDGSHTSIQLHETLGHALELDRVLGMEAATAGTSFLTLSGLGSYRVGSDLVSVRVDPTALAGIGSFFYDDDGVPAQQRPLIESGRHVDYLSSRDTAAIIGHSSTACSRAASWNHLPLVRMTTVELEPGNMSLAELIADSEDAFLLETTRSWSVDEQRLNFQFGVEAAREIKHGSLGKLYRGPVYADRTPDFWRRCDAIGSAADQQWYGVNRCFKGQPGQLVRLSHLVAPARFRNVELRRG
jgi:TldD protein